MPVLYLVLEQVPATSAWVRGHVGPYFSGIAAYLLAGRRHGRRLAAQARPPGGAQMTGPLFWKLLAAACLLWYATITVYVAIRGARDIKDHAAEAQGDRRKRKTRQ